VPGVVRGGRIPIGKTRQEVVAKLAKALSDWEGGLTFIAGSLKWTYISFVDG
jgi:hypothetical protein